MDQCYQAEDVVAIIAYVTEQHLLVMIWVFASLTDLFRIKVADIVLLEHLELCLGCLDLLLTFGELTFGLVTTRSTLRFLLTSHLEICAEGLNLNI